MNWVALRMLMGDRAKFFGVVFGVTLASMLIVHQVTIFTGLMARTWSIVQDLRDSAQPDLLVMDPGTEFLDDVKPLGDTALQKVRSVEGVAWAVPWYKGQIKARMSGGKFRTAIVIGLDDSTLLGAPPMISGGVLADLRKPDAIIVDELHARGLLADQTSNGSRSVSVGDTVELNDHTAKVVALCHSTRPFISQPIVFTTVSNAMRWSPPERRKVSAVLVGLKAGTDPSAVRAELASAGLAAHTPDGFGWRCVRYYLTNTGIPINFGITVILGAVVGIAITGQTFYLFILDNLRNLAALKAMGAGNWLIARMISLQTGVSGALGFGMGCLGATLLFVPFTGTEVDFKLYWQILVLGSLFTLLIIALATAAGLRRVWVMEPAVVFK